MSSTNFSDAAANNDRGRGHTRTFFGLPAELRNEIYKLTFAAETKSRLKPHPLTHTSRQVRQECLTLYYASITYLKIPVGTSQQIACTKRWLAEIDVAHFPVLPTIEFSPWWLSKNKCKANPLAHQKIKIDNIFRRMI